VVKLLALSLILCASVAQAAAPTQGQTTQPIILRNQHNLTLRALTVQNAPGNCIELHNCSNVLIENCTLGPSIGEGVHLIGCTSVTIHRINAQHIRTGVYAVNCSGVRVLHSSFKNVQGPMPRGQMVQFNNVTGAANAITDNRVENELGKSNPEDAISLYKSFGIPDSPILVGNNLIIGGGPSPSGGGIMSGDNGGAHILVRNNRLLDPGQYGIAIAGGTHIRILDNLVYARSQPLTNVGVYVWNQSPGPCANHEVRGNQVRWYNKSGALSGAWNSNNCGPVTGWDDNNWSAEGLTTAVLLLGSGH